MDTALSNPFAHAIEELEFQQKRELELMPSYMRACVQAMWQDDKSLFVKAVATAAGHLDEKSGGIALIHRAARQSDDFYLKHLVAAGADFNLMSSRTPSYPPIAEAVLEGNQDHVDFLLAKKADLSLCGENGVPFVFWLFKEAVTDISTMMKRSSLKAVTSLMPHLDHSLRDDRGRPLMVAVIENLPFDAVRLLKESGYPVGIVDIEAAVMHGRIKSTRLLLEGKDVIKSFEDVERLQRTCVHAKKIMAENIVSASQLLRAENFWRVRDDIFDPPKCFNASFQAIDRFHAAECERLAQARIERAVDHIYRGGDKPLPIPGRRM